MENGIKWVLCCGLNDKAARVQFISTLDAFRVASSICARIAGGATITEGRGVYTHEDGEIIQETTLVIQLFGASEDVARAVADALKTALNQESIAVEKVCTVSAFW